MAGIKRKLDENGRLQYADVQVYRGLDAHGKRLPPWTKRFTPEKKWSDKAIERELAKFAADFSEACKRGDVLTREEARKAKIEAEQAEQDKTLSLAGRYTLERYVREIYMPVKEISMAENGRVSYETNLRLRILPELGDSIMEDITPMQIELFLASLQKKGRTHSTIKGKVVVTDKPLAYSSVIKVYTILSSIFRMASKKSIIPSNPMEKVDRPAKKKDDPITGLNCYEEDEARRILNLILLEPIVWQAYIQVAMDTGARRGEISGLKWDDIDFKTGAVHIQRNLQYSPSKGIYATTTKNRQTRFVFVSEYTLLTLGALRASQAVKCYEGYIFQSKGKVMSPQSATRYFARFGKKYGIEDFHPHALRHTAATIAITNKIDVATVSKTLGHAQTSTTENIYTHPSTKAVQNASAAYQNILYGGVAKYGN